MALLVSLLDLPFVILANCKDDPMNSEMESKYEERMIEFGTANRQNNVSLDDEISPEGIMTVS